MPKTTKLTSELMKRLEGYTSTVSVGYKGVVKEISDGVAKISGLATLSYSEIVEFPGGILGVAINLEEDEVGAIVLGDYLKIGTGSEVKGTNRLLSIGVSESLIGRVI
ncbi:MAG: hypothetical protein ACD_51C00036G0001, partial [uncultured bacterium]